MSESEGKIVNLADYLKKKRTPVPAIKSTPREFIDSMQNDKLMTPGEVYDFIWDETLPRIEQTILNIPEYVSAAAKAHFDQNREVVFDQGEFTYGVYADKYNNYYRIAKFVKEKDGTKTVIEDIAIDGGTTENPDQMISYLGPNVYLQDTRSNEKFSKYNTWSVSSGIRLFLNNLESVSQAP